MKNPLGFFLTSLGWLHKWVKFVYEKYLNQFSFEEFQKLILIVNLFGQDSFRPESGMLRTQAPTSSISDFNYFYLNKTFYMTCAIHKVRVYYKEITNLS